MRKKLKKSLQIYLSKLKKPSASYTTAKMLSGCRYPKTVSFSRDKEAAAALASPSTGDSIDDPDHSATLTDIDHFLSVNFRSLYLADKEEPSAQAGHTARKNRFESTRFFIPTGKTRSLAQEARLSSTSTMSSENTSSENSAPSSTTLSDGSETPLRSRSKLQDDSVAVLRYSPEPYEDFRKSMLEMIESRYEEGAKVDWDFMEELLFCYLNLNEKRSYKYIISAFVNLITVLRQNSVRVPATLRCRKSRSTGARGARREV